MFYFKIMCGGKVNDTTDSHITVLLKDKLNITNLLISKEVKLTNDERSQYEDCIRMIDVAIETIQIDDKKNIITILGFTAGGALAKFLLTIVASGLFAAFRFLSS